MPDLPRRGIPSALRDATHIAVLTGAGVSSESGIATFRDKQTGLWERFDAVELATAAAFARDPSLVWGWYEWRRMSVCGALPNAAHRAIAAMAQLVARLTLITQNVDDLHERAGSAAVLHLHGRLDSPYCETCRRPHELDARIAPISSAGARLEPPRCAFCGARVRPGVVWFGESLPAPQWQAAYEAVQRCDVLLVCGTSAVVQPAASLIDTAIAGGALTVQVNPNVTDYDETVSSTLRGSAGEILPRLLQEAWGVMV